MIYVCVPSYNEAATIGLLLWKVRKVFAEFPREYQLLVADDGSSDQTAETLGPYGKVLPLTVVQHPSRVGYARSVEELLRLAVERTDRPKRDCAIVMHADFRHGPEFLPELVKRIESGADVVVAQGTVKGETSRALRWLRRGAPLILGRGVRVPGVSDSVSGFAAFRLITLRSALRAQPGPLLTAEGWAANAELCARAAQYARRIDTVDTIERHDLRQRPTRVRPWAHARELWREGRRIHLVPVRAQVAEATP